LEFLHDNRDDIDVMRENDNCCDMISRKKIIIDTSVLNPESVMKEHIFKNINYKNLQIINTPYKDNIIIDDIAIFKNTIVLVFDNMQLRHDNIKLMRHIFKDKIIKIYIPFVFFAEQLLKNINANRMKQIIEKYRQKYAEYCDEIIIDDYFTESEESEEPSGVAKLNAFYKKEADDIGFYFDDINDKLINHNVFSNNNNLIKDGKINESKKKDFYHQLEIVYKYLQNFKINDNIDSPGIDSSGIDSSKTDPFNIYIDKLRTDFELYFTDNKKIKDQIIFSSKTIYTTYNNVRSLVMSVKEARDSYYLIETNRISSRALHRDSQFFYITTDEITNCRCILEKISSINILGDVPRYIISIRSNKIILKLFNIFQNLIKVTDTENDIYKMIENVRKINSQKILHDAKSLIIKEYVGGKLKTNEQTSKFEVFTLDLKKYGTDEKNYKLHFMKNIDYEQILHYIDQTEDKRFKLFSLFHFDDFKNIEDITKQNPRFTKTIEQCNEIFVELEYLYDSTDPQELIANLKKNPENSTKICNFMKNIGPVFTGNNYKKFEHIRKKTFSDSDWKGIYCGWWLNIGLNYKYSSESLKFYKYIFPKLFASYPIDDFITMFNIESECVQNECDQNECVHNECVCK